MQKFKWENGSWSIDMIESSLHMQFISMWTCLYQVFTEDTVNRRRGDSRLYKSLVNNYFDCSYTVCYAFQIVHEGDNKSSHEALSNLFFNSQHFLAFSFLRRGMYLDAVLMLTTSRSTTYSFRSLHADNMNDLINHFLKYSSSSNTTGVHDWLTWSCAYSAAIFMNTVG